MFSIKIFILIIVSSGYVDRTGNFIRGFKLQNTAAWVENVGFLGGGGGRRVV